jgi:thiol-disulfide isomerase/thioredoxin
MSVNIDVIKAQWCIHCKNLMKKWEEIVAEIEKNNGIKLNFNIYEDTTQKKEIEKLIKEKGYVIEGFPTIYITINNNKPIVYNGAREAEEMSKFIKSQLQPIPQAGGKKKDDTYYEKKYYKYKAKYLELKHTI